MDEKLDIILERIKLQVERIASDAESEKATRKRRNEEFDKKLEKFREAIYGNGKEGLVTRITKLENERDNKRNVWRDLLTILALIISALALILK